MFAAILDPVLTDAGFTRTGRGWYQQTDESIVMVDLQRSSIEFYINLGVYYRK